MSSIIYLSSDGADKFHYDNFSSWFKAYVIFFSIILFIVMIMKLIVLPAFAVRLRICHQSVEREIKDSRRRFLTVSLSA